MLRGDVQLNMSVDNFKKINSKTAADGTAAGSAVSKDVPSF